MSRLVCTIEDVISILEYKLHEDIMSDIEYDLYLEFLEIGDEVFEKSEYSATIKKLKKDVRELWGA